MKSVQKTKVDNSGALYVYDVKGNLKATTTVNQYCKTKRKSKTAVMSACKSFKGYGFVEDEFVSLTPIKRFYSTNEVVKMFNDWLKNNLDKNVVKLKAMYRKKYNDEYLYQALLYITEAINSPRSVNNFEQALVYKYKTCFLDEQRKVERRRDNGLREDIIITDDAGNSISYIDTYATEDDDLWNEKKYYCVEDYNSIKRFDVIGYILKEKYPSDAVDMFIEMLQGEYEFDTLSNTPKFRYMTLIRKYKGIVKSLKKDDCSENKALSDSKYLEYFTQELWNEMNNNLSRIIEESDRYTYKSLEDYTLAELIE